MGHLWSLAVEEQFYLLWPLTLVFARRRRATWTALSVVCLVPLIRLIEWQQVGALGGTFETAADALALGCLFALALSYSFYLWQELFINRHAGTRAFAFPLDVGLAVPCALASYYAVERPFLGLRSRAER